MTLRLMSSSSSLQPKLHEVFNKIQSTMRSPDRLDYDVWSYQDQPVDVLVNHLSRAPDRFLSDTSQSSIEALYIRAQDFLFVSSYHVNIPQELFSQGILSAPIKQTSLFYSVFGAPTARFSYMDVDGRPEGLLLERKNFSEVCFIRYSGADMFIE